MDWPKISSQTFSAMFFGQSFLTTPLWPIQHGQPSLSGQPDQPPGQPDLATAARPVRQVPGPSSQASQLQTASSRSKPQCQHTPPLAKRGTNGKTQPTSPSENSKIVSPARKTIFEFFKIISPACRNFLKIRDFSKLSPQLVGTF